MSVHENDIIKTLAKSRCEISLIGGGKLRIGQNSELETTLANVKPMEKNFEATLKKVMYGSCKSSVWREERCG